MKRSSSEKSKKTAVTDKEIPPISKPDEEDDLELWGHVGLLLYGVGHTKWYPVTWKMASSFMQRLNDVDTPFVWLETLNNRTLSVNPLAVKRIMVLDDDAGPPPDWHMEFGDNYQGEPAEFYEVLEEQILGDSYEGVPFKTKNAVKAFIDNHNLGEDEIVALTLLTFFYDKNGLIGDELIEVTDLAELDIMLQDDMPTVLEVRSYSRGSYCYYPTNSLALVDMPSVQVKNGYKQIEIEDASVLEDVPDK